MDSNRQTEIRNKGFDIMNSSDCIVTDYGKIKVNTKTLDDAILNLGSIQGATPGMINKAIIYRALLDNDIVRLREISNYFYKASGIYQKVCNYLLILV